MCSCACVVHGDGGGRWKLYHLAPVSRPLINNVVLARKVAAAVLQVACTRGMMWPWVHIVPPLWAACVGVAEQGACCANGQTE